MTGTLDLGVVDAPLLVFGGPYGNLEAMRALFAEAERLGIPRSRMLCTGDVVAYCGDPRATADLLREAGIPVVMGNCEESLGVGAGDCGCGFEEGTACQLLSVAWYAHADRSLDRGTRRWMAGLPRRVRFTMAGRSLLAVHGGVDEINRFLFPASPASEVADELDRAGADGVICGHSGLPFTAFHGARMWHNAGVIGLPANDGTPRVWFSVLAPTADGIVVEHRALAYDHAAAAGKVRASGLPGAYAIALETGIWPNDDIMPEADRARRGVALTPVRELWLPAAMEGEAERLRQAGD
jgi:diadenosine tetraphosphatase ApaH/serine/threonine PP2A family protein phosphatase